MRKIFFKSPREDGATYKVNLHCHSTISDGQLTVEELKENYKKHGYSAVAFSDHELFVPHNDLTDENFVALNAVEYALNYKKNRDDKTELSQFLRPTVHMLFIAKNPDEKVAPVYKENPPIRPYQIRNEGAVIWREDGLALTKESQYEGYMDGSLPVKMLQMGKDEGFFTVYNHPEWSYENYPLFSRYKGMDAMEIYNGSAVNEGFGGSSQVFQDFHALGRKVYCVATDDNHNQFPEGHPRSDSYGGFIRIAAEKLSYEDLMKNLSEGNFYAGTGIEYHESPVIKEITFDDETRELKVKTSAAKKIAFMGVRTATYSGAQRAEEGKSIEEASFTIKPGCHEIWVWARDEEGFCSYSQVYYLDGTENEKELKPFLLDNFNGKEWE